MEDWAKRIAQRRWMQGVIFFAAFILIIWLAGLPLEWFSQSKEKDYAVSVQGWGSWIGDQAKSLGLTLLIAVPILLLFNWIVRRWPRRYWLGIWVATVPILIFLIFVSPLLEPIFNKFEPLETHHAALVAKLEMVVARTGINIPPNRMFLMKASEKYNGINAYVTGVGATKRYVMWDTATDRLPDDEVMFVFGHESGHYVLKHIPKLIAGMCAGLFFVYWACAAFAAWLAKRNGARWGLEGGAIRWQAVPGSWFCCLRFRLPVFLWSRFQILSAATLNTRRTYMGRKLFTESWPIRSGPPCRPLITWARHGLRIQAPARS